jgi:hypothetical protein
MKRYAILALLVLLALPAFAAVEARIVSVDGTVRVSAGDGSWQEAEAGTLLGSGDMIATGFRGSAVIEIGRSEVDVSPLSQVSIAELAEREDVDAARLSMPFGKVNARVRSAENRRADFRVVSPVSTASVRGTDFVYDGISLQVSKGDVAIENLIGQTHSVRAGQESRAYAHEPIVSVEAYLEEEALLD